MTGVNRAIPTRYKDILFRSKLEADWAISLDGYGIKWEYEPEGRYWGDVFYAPDFWLPLTRQWFEVKGDPQPADFAKWAALAKHWEREPTPECYGFLATSLGYELYLKALQSAQVLDVPPLVIGLPKGVLQLPELVADLAAHGEECDEEGIPYWPDKCQDVVLIHGMGFVAYDQLTGPPAELHDKDGIWLAWNGFPYRNGTPTCTARLA